tara:strand:+ start:179 stop:568 length:390 start_codon:yes stop_codon:yes gene_type:complete
MSRDIENLEDIKLMVDEFYGKVKMNPLIGPIFIGAIKDNWPAHLQKLYNFWETVLLGQRTYTGSPFVPHAQMPIEKKHFDVWLGLFYETVNTHFDGEKANEAKLRATKMAEMFLHKINYFKEHPNQRAI